MRTIYLVRHCDYDLSHGELPGRLPVELSEKGLLQATMMQQFFADKNISHIYSSAVWRCKQTSNMISFGTIPISFDPRLLETFSAFQGYWYTGEKVREFFYGNREELGGETYGDVFSRVSSFYSEVLQTADNVIVCSHGDVLMMLYMVILGNQLPEDSKFEKVCDQLGYIHKGAVRIITFNTDNHFELQKVVQF